MTKLKGKKAFLRKLKDAVKRIEKAEGAGLYAVGNNIMTESKEKYCPVDFGTLRGSGYVTEPQKKHGEVVVEIGYGGQAKDYAVVQHEDTSLNHQNGKQAKYLEKPLDDAAADYVQEVAAFARQAFKNNKGFTRNPQMPTTPTKGGS